MRRGSAGARVERPHIDVVGPLFFLAHLWLPAGTSCLPSSIQRPTDDLMGYPSNFNAAVHKDAEKSLQIFAWSYSCLLDSSYTFSEIGWLSLDQGSMQMISCHLPQPNQGFRLFSSPTSTTIVSSGGDSLALGFDAFNCFGDPGVGGLKALRRLPNRAGFR
jgi:hypothetical protein